MNNDKKKMSSDHKISLSSLTTSANSAYNGGKIPKRTLRCKTNADGNILSIHFTFNDEKNVAWRVKLEAGCFNGHGQYVLVDRQGNIFVFDFALKLYWKLPFLLLKANCIKASLWKQGVYYLGTRNGDLIEFDTEKGSILRRLEVCAEQRIDTIDFLQEENNKTKTAILQSIRQAILIDLENFVSTHRLDFETANITLSFASFMPNSEYIFTSFTDDSIMLWSSTSLESTRVVNITKAKDKIISAKHPNTVKEFDLADLLREHEEEVLMPEYTDGNILTYCFSIDGQQLYIATSDCYLILMEAQTFKIHQLIRLKEFVVKQCLELSCAKHKVLLGLSYNGKVIVFDLINFEMRLLFECKEEIIRLEKSKDSKLLALFFANGECQIWSVLVMLQKLQVQRQTMAMLKSAIENDKSSEAESKVTASSHLLNANLRKILTKSKISELLREYSHFPAKYRLLIWTSLMKLPGNQEKYQELRQLPVVSNIVKTIYDLQIKEESLKRNLSQIWIALSHWCKVLAYSEFLPHFMFPFVKNFPDNTFFVFELLMTLIVNHCSLWFELHPLPPINYIGIIENLLQHYEPDLCRFYLAHKVDAKMYTWSLLSNGFSEVLDQEQWACLWDHVLFNPPQFLLFVVVAYNIMQKDLILHLPDKRAINYFFHDQNPITMSKLMDKAYKLMITCPAELNPSQFIKAFQPLPRGVYPKFLNYPKQLLEEHESILNQVKMQQHSIDTRIRQLEMEEVQMMCRLNDGLKEERELMLLREMERKYKESIREEEERLATQRKMLVLYQKQVRNKKEHMMNALQKTKQRKQLMLAESEYEVLCNEIESQRLRHDAEFIIAEEDVKNRELNILAQSVYGDAAKYESLAAKYRNDWQRVKEQRFALNHELAQVTSVVPLVQKSSKLEQIACTLEEIHDEFTKLKSS